MATLMTRNIQIYESLMYVEYFRMFSTGEKKVQKWYNHIKQPEVIDNESVGFHFGKRWNRVTQTLL